MSLQGRVHKGRHRQYRMADYQGANFSGLRPVGDRLLVLVDEVIEKTAGGVILPQAAQERGSAACTQGTLIDVGPDAFRWNFDRTARWEGEKPKPGDRVYFQRYAGELYEGVDGQEYRVMDDKGIGAIGFVPAKAKAIAAE